MNSTRHQIDLNSTGPMPRVDWAIARYNWYRACGLLGDTPQSNAQVTAYRRSSDPPPPKPHLKWYPLSKPEGASRDTTVRSVATTLPSHYSRRTDADHARSMSARHPAENHFTQKAAWQHSSNTSSPIPHLKWYPLSKPDGDRGDAITEPTANEHRRLPHRSNCHRVENAHAGAMLSRYQAGSESGTTREFDESEHPRAERGQHNGGQFIPVNKSDAVQQWHLRPAVAQPSPHTSAAGSDSAPSTPIELWTGGEKETAESRIRDRIIALSHKYRSCKISEPFLFDTLTRSPAPFNMSVYDPKRLSTAISFYDPETEACDTVDIQTGNLLWHESGSKELAFVAPKPNWLEAYQAKAARTQRLQDAMVLAAPNRTTATVPARSPIAIVRPAGSALRGQPVSVQMPSTAGASLSRGGRTVPPARRHYSVAFQVTLDQPIWGRSHSVHQNRANAELDRAIRSDPEFAKQMEMLIPGVTEDVARKGGRETPPNYIWHHATIGQGHGRAGTMQLVPLEQHTSGSQYWNVLHPNPGGGGGYSEWARPAGAPSRH